MTTRQLQQVALTYSTRRFVQAIVALSGAFCVLMLVAIWADGGRKMSDSEGALGLLAIPSVLFAFLLASQAKWQFVDPRARIVPRFATNHVALLVGLALLSLGLAPALLGWLFRANMLGSTACSIAIGSSMIWLIQGMAGRALLLGLGTAALMIRPGAPFWLAPELASLTWPYQLMLLVAGWAAFGGWLVRLVNLSEEQRDYSLPIFIQTGSATRLERTQASRVAARLFPNSASSSPSWFTGDYWHDRLAGMRALNTRARQQLLRYGFSPAPAWHIAASMIVGYAVMLCLISMFKEFRAASSGNLSYFSMMIAMPTVLAPGALMMRRGRMPQELLLPLSRRAYVDGLLKAVARNAAMTWSMTQVAILALIALLSPQTMSASFILALTVLSLSAHLYAFGVFTWIAQTQSAGRRLLATLLVSLPAMGALSGGIKASVAPPPPPYIHAPLPASFGEGLTAEQRTMIEQFHQRQDEQLRKSRETNSAMAWGIAAALGSTGAVCTVISRRKWLDLELA